MRIEEHTRLEPGESWYQRNAALISAGQPVTQVPRPKDDRRVIGAYTDDGVQMGYLDWHTDGEAVNLPHMIAQITVHPEYRRQGVATQLFRHAQRLDPLLQHSSVRTELGDLWAKSTGDPVPVRYLSRQKAGRRGHYYVTDRVFDFVTRDIEHKIRNEAAWEPVVRTGVSVTG